MRKRHRNYGWLSNFVSPYGASSGGAMVLPTPQFEVPFYTGSVTPTIAAGSAPTFTRASIQNYYSDNTTISQKSSGQFPGPHFNYNKTELLGGYLASAQTGNYCLYSEDFSNAAWVDVGTVTITGNDAVAPDGTTTADLFEAGANNSGKLQDVATLAAENLGIVFSAYIKRAGGSDVSCTLQLSGTGATPETGTKAVTATSIWTRVYMYVKFTGSATGNVTPQITIDTSGASIHVWGAMVESVFSGATYSTFQKVPAMYIATTSALATKNTNVLTYPSNNFTSLMSVGSICVWACVNYGATGSLATTEVTQGGNLFGVFGMNDLAGILLMHQTNGGDGRTRLYWYINSQVVVQPIVDPFTKDTWFHYAMCWDNSGATIDAEFFINGVSVATNTSSTITTPAANTLAMGCRTTGQLAQYWKGQIGLFQWFDSKLGSTDVVSLYNDKKTSFGL